MTMTPLQAERLKLWYDHDQSYTTAAEAAGVHRSTFTDSVKAALVYQDADPGLRSAMDATGLGGAIVTGGWRIVQETMEDGTIVRNSVRYAIKPDDQVEPVDVAQTIIDALLLAPRAVPVAPPTEDLPEDLCNFIPLADLHVGGEYGDPLYLDHVYAAITRLMHNLPKAHKAVLLDMGDLLDANDHKGLTPASGNFCDVIRENHLQNTIDALNIMRYAIGLLLHTHNEVEVHLLRGNHDETAFIGVMVALHAHFKDDPRVNVILSDDDFRVLSWGKCAVFPHHGDKCKWEDLKDVFSDQFPDAWAEAKYWRFIWTAHVHHDKQKQLVGADAEHFRTLAKPNKWAQQKGFFTRGGIQAVTLHKEDGEVDRTKVNLKPLLLQDIPRKAYM
jgi:hypothetical protein